MEQKPPNHHPSDVLDYLRWDVREMDQAIDRVIGKYDGRYQGVLRAYIRTVCAYFEGFITAMKYHCLDIHYSNLNAGQSSPLSVAEVFYLEEAEQAVHSLDDKGRARSSLRPLAIRFRDNLRFTIRTVARLDGFHVDFGDEGWASVMRVIDVRDRITHPRSVRDLDVLNDDYKLVCKIALRWVDSILEKCQAAHGTPPFVDPPEEGSADAAI